MSCELLLHFNEGAGVGAFHDASGRGRSAVGVGACVASAAQAKFGATSLKPDSAAAGYASVSGGPAGICRFRYMPNWTIDWWQYLNNLTNEHGVFATRKIADTTYGFGIAVEASTGLFVLREASGNNRIAFSGSATAGQWQHIALVTYGTIGVITLYIDGVASGSITLGSPVLTLDNFAGDFLFLGYKPNNGGTGSTFDGYIDDFRVTHNHALFTGPFTPPTVAAAGNLSISNVNPNSGPTPGGNLVSIIGSGFVTGTTAKIDGNAMTGITVVSDELMTGYAPAGTVGLKDVSVHAP